MRRMLYVSLAVLAAACSSSSSNNNTGTPAEACTSFAVASCNRIYACFPSTAGTSAECANTIETESGCATANCGTQTYNATAASQCITDFENQACTDVQNGVTPDSCNNVCQ